MRNLFGDHIRNDRTARPARAAAAIVGIAACCFLVTGFRAWMQAQPNALPFLPPLRLISGAGIALCLLLGLEGVAGVFLGTALSLVLFSHYRLLLAAEYAGTVAATTALAVGLLRRSGFDPQLRHSRDIFLLLAWGALAPTSLNLLFHWTIGIGEASAPFAMESGKHLWIGAFSLTIGTMAIAPAILLLGTPGESLRSSPRDKAERTLFCLAGLAVGLFVFCRSWEHTPLSQDMEYLAFPLLIWAPLRLGLRGSLPTALALMSTALYGTLHRLGPFEQGDPVASTASLQFFLAVSALTSLLLGAVRDERERFVRRLAERERLLDGLFHNAPFHILIKDLKGRYLMANRALEKLWGLSLRDILGQTDARFLDPHAVALAQATDREALRRGETIRYEQIIPDKEGEKHHTSITKFSIPDPRGQPSAVCVLGRDVTQERLAENERDQFFSLAPDLFCVAGCDGKLVRVNPAFGAAAGHAPEELAGRPIGDFLEEKDGDALSRHFEQGKPVRGVETRWRHRDGSTRIVSWEVFPDPARRVVYASGRDVTGRKQEEALLLRAVENAREANVKMARAIAESHKLARDAEEANRAKGVFLAVMSHELRTPINGMMGSGQLLQTTELSAEQEEYVRILLNCGQGLKRLVNDILDFSRIEAGTMGVANAPFNLEASVRHVVQTFVPDAFKKGVTLYQVANVRDLPRSAVGDEMRLRQVLSNLLNNAIKFTETGNIVVRTKVVARTPQGIDLLFTVQDSGIGIAPEEAEAIFQPFFQVDSSPTRSYGGAGLGLAICKKLVTMMGGHIWMESEPGRGSSFHFTLHLALEPGEAPSAVLPGAGRDPLPKGLGLLHPQARYGALRVLLAEDEAPNREVMLHFLGKVGISADAVSNGREAVASYSRALAAHPYDLVLMDIQMPLLDGLGATAQIRALEGTERHAHVVALTAYGMPSDRERFLRAGLDEVLLKPLSLHDLVAALDHCAAAAKTAAA